MPGGAKGSRADPAARTIRLGIPGGRVGAAATARALDWAGPVCYMQPAVQASHSEGRPCPESRSGDRLTLPEDLRQVLTSAETDSVEAEEVDEGVLLRRSQKTRRNTALADIRAAQAGVSSAGAEPRPNPGEEERQIADFLEADKADQRPKPR